jgi:hypothetical protein
MIYEKVIGGAQVLMPNWELLKPEISRLFADPKFSREGANVLVLNGTNVTGEASRARDKLMMDGVPVAAVATAPNGRTLTRTVVTDYTGGSKPDTLKAILKTLGLDETAVEEGSTTEWIVNAEGEPIYVAQEVSEESSPVDIVVTIGGDQVAARRAPTPAP